MKRLVPAIAVFLPLVFFSACGPSKNPEANVSTASPAASGATITASPNPVILVGDAPGTTTITWNTEDGSAGTIYLSKDGGPEGPFASGGPGSAPAPWIEAGKTYEFRLYAGTEHTKMLAKIQVTGHK